MVVCRRTRTDASASNPHPFPRCSVPRGCPRNYGLACQKANSDSTSWTTTEKWLNCEVGLDDATGFTRRHCTTMRKLCRPSGGSNTHVLGLLPSHSEYRTRSLIVLCSIIYPFARWLFLLSSCAKDASLTRMPNQVLRASLTIPRLLTLLSSIQSVPVSLSLRRG
jgi:hypothetical protein